METTARNMSKAEFELRAKQYLEETGLYAPGKEHLAKCPLNTPKDKRVKSFDLYVTYKKAQERFYRDVYPQREDGKKWKTWDVKEE